jgi:uncharacterized membrane protein YdbT with pleckstrin-like domain
MDQENNKYANELGVALLDGEEVVKDVYKHPIGAFISLFTGIGVSLAVLTITIVMALFMNSSSDFRGPYSGIVLVIGILLSVLALIATLIYVYLYKQNRLIITTEKVALIKYSSIFSRQVTQLSIERVQDVAVQQVGVLPRVYKYGTILIETAGEVEQCVFAFAPTPYDLSKTIMDVHEKAVSKSRQII